MCPYPVSLRTTDERIGLRSNEVPTLEHWKSQALSQAEAIDPRARSPTHLNEWFEKFRLNRRAAECNEFGR